MTVQSNIPVPHGFKTENMLMRLDFKLPWDTMKLGDSFWVPGANKKDRANVYVSASRKGLSIKTELTDDGMRVWLVGYLVGPVKDGGGR